MNQQKGFTLVELLLSMAFFSFIMMFVIIGFVQINRSYTRGLTVKKVQNSAREVIESISLAIRDAEGNDVEIHDTFPGNMRMCIGNTRYAWNMAPIFNFEPYAGPPDLDGPPPPITLARTTFDAGGCTSPVYENPPLGETQKLLDDNLIVQYLDISRIGTTNSFNVTLVISTDALSAPTDFSTVGIDAACEIQAGDQFCDVARIDTVVTARN